MKTRSLVLKTAFFMAFLLVIGLITPYISYADDPSPWASTEVQQAVEAGLIPVTVSLGYRENTNRLEFCHLVMRLIQAKTGMSISDFLRVKGVEIEPLTFSDTNDSLILAANALGIVNGVGNNRFDPFGQLQRQQAAAMLSRAAKALGYTDTGEPGMSFSDRLSFQDYAVEPIEFISGVKDRISGKRVMGGLPNNMFGPASPYTKEQAILTMLRMYNSFDFIQVARVVGIDSIEGKPMPGHKLTAGEITYDSIPQDNPVLQWQWVISQSEDGTYTPIPGAVKRDYTPSTDEVGKYLNVIVTAEGAAYGSGISFPVLIEPFQLVLAPIKPIEGFYPIDADLPFDGGKGTNESPFLISTAEQLDLLKSNTTDTYFKLTQDINLGNLTERITNTFLGHLDGDGHKITFSYAAGLFRQIGAGASVKNLIVAGGITGENPKGISIGRLADTNYGTIEKCGVDMSSMILKSAVNVRVGGLVGTNYGLISQSYASGIIKVQLVKREAINGSYRSLADDILGNDYNKGWVGGLCGVNAEGATIKNCWSNSTVILEAPGDMTYGISGGLAGSNNGSISKCYTVGSVSSNKYRGAISGSRGSGSLSQDCYYDMDTFRLSDTYAGQPKTSLQMVQRSTYAGWDDTIWRFETGTIDYPKLFWQE
ncbi:S-layer homology domain-containing protein [Gudongella oleilytica]|jgi:hypothetical protein|uniref:S-layer homology domain-containing protein n=1 Tax=Gudongella oleilytica TaxID=1582259 RepID=UPI000EF11819|nr:S-layer homology domain-containing protein [Gudongella oleilytica]MDY0257492.1 S-layer homology domain-containing protein [Gudongella oleilytica]HCO18034.1 hypothetical protein [Tissierellales bacterium]